MGEARSLKFDYLRWWNNPCFWVSFIVYFLFWWGSRDLSFLCSSWAWFFFSSFWSAQTFGSYFKIL